MNEKSIYNKIMKFLSSVEVLSLTLNSLNLQESTSPDFNYDSNRIVNDIEIIERSWKEINNSQMNFSDNYKNNIIEEINNTKNDVAEDLISIKKHNYKNKDEILKYLSLILNRLNSLNERLIKME